MFEPTNLRYEATAQPLYRRCSLSTITVMGTIKGPIISVINKL